jgi:nucleotide-binding universal stress UspA family protein
MTTVLLAVDESEASMEAARRARELFGTDATYLAVNVAERVPTWTAQPMPWGAVYPFPLQAAAPMVAVPGEATIDADGPTAPADAARDTAETVSAAVGVDAAAIGEVGDPASAILDAAASHGADVIVIGSTHKGWWRRLFEGSVSRDVVRESPLPVLLIGEPDGG